MLAACRRAVLTGAPRAVPTGRLQSDRSAAELQVDGDRAAQDRALAPLRPSAPRRRTLVGALSLLACANTSHSWSREPLDTSGIEFDPELMVRGARLRLNGAGTRYKFVVRVYAAALYTPALATTPEAALDQRTPRLLRVVMVRDIDAEELGRLLTAGIERN
jgi:hypothetical protein